MLPEFPFTLPACGKTLIWRPLPVGASLDVTAANASTPTNLGAALLIKRVISYDGKEGPPTPNDWRAWEEIDYDAFAEEVQEKEAARKAMFRKKRAGENVDGALTGAIIECQQHALNLGRALSALTELLEIQKAASGPLASPAT